MNDLVSKEALSAAKVRLHEKWKGWDSGVCQGAVVDLDGDSLIMDGHKACHSWVNSAFKINLNIPNSKGGYGYTWGSKYREDAKPFLVLSCHKNGSSSQESSDFLIKWLAREGPFSEFVLNKDDDESLTQGGMILLCGPGGLNLAQALWMCKVSRFTTEGNKAAEVFHELVKGGVDGMVAIYVASYIRGGDSKKGYSYTGLDLHSTVIEGTFGGHAKTDILGFISRRLNFEPVSTMTVFEPISDSLKDKKALKLIEGAKYRVQGFSTPKKVSDGWGGTVDGNGCSTDELVANVKAWETELKAVLNSISGTPSQPDSSTVYLDVDM